MPGKKRSSSAAAAESKLKSPKLESPAAASAAASASAPESIATASGGLFDEYNCPVLTSSSACITAINSYLKAVFYYGPTRHWDVISQAVAADKNCVIAHVLLADREVANENMTAAFEHLKTARALSTARCADSSAAGSDREALYVAMYDAWLRDGDLSRAADVAGDVLTRWPSDLFAVKRASLFHFVVADHPRMLAVCERSAVKRACESRPFYWGILGFALEENARWRDAEDAGRRGTAMLADDNWSHHAVAHSLLGQSRIRDGLEWMHAHARHWDVNAMPFMYTHNWFHVALFYLEINDYWNVEQIWEQHIWPSKLQTTRDIKPASSAAAAADSKSSSIPALIESDKSDLEVQMNALILLWKWQLYEELNGDTSGRASFRVRWRDVIDRMLQARSAAKKSSIIGFPFADLLYLNGMYSAGYDTKADAFTTELIDSYLPAKPKAESAAAAPAPAPVVGSNAHVRQFVLAPAARSLQLYHRIPSTAASDHKNSSAASGASVETAMSGVYSLLHAIIEPLAVKGVHVGGSNEQRTVLMDWFWSVLARAPNGRTVLADAIRTNIKAAQLANSYAKTGNVAGTCGSAHLYRLLRRYTDVESEQFSASKAADAAIAVVATLKSDNSTTK